jgi:HEPN domain-containing protein
MSEDLAHARAELLEGAERKLSAARLLLDAGLPSEAYYMAGYAVELLLKAIIARRFQGDTIPSLAFVRQIYTHDLEKLASVAGLQDDIAKRRRTDRTFSAAWEEVTQWSPDARYRLNDMDIATSYLGRLTGSANEEGIVPWMKRFL